MAELDFSSDASPDQVIDRALKADRATADAATPDVAPTPDPTPSSRIGDAFAGVAGQPQADVSGDPDVKQALGSLGGPAMGSFQSPTIPTNTVNRVVADITQQDKTNASDVLREALPRRTPPPMPQAEQTPGNIMRGAIGAFSNPLMWLAIAGSTMTRRPAINALTAATGVLTGLNENDYRRAYLNTHKFRNSVKESLSQIQSENAAYEPIINDPKMSEADKLANLGGLAAAHGDTTMQQYLKMGDLGKVQELVQGRKHIGEHTSRAIKNYDKQQDKLTKQEEAAEKLAGKPDPLYEDQAQELARTGNRDPIKHFTPTVQARITARANKIKPTLTEEEKKVPAGIPEATKNQLAQLGWDDASIDAQARTYNRTGIMPKNLGSREYAGLITGAINNRATQIWNAENPNRPIEERSKDWQLYRSAGLAINRFTSGVQGNTIRSLSVVVDHLATLDKLATALQNGEIPVFNRIAQAWAEQTGQPAPTNFDTAKSIIGTEVIKALGVAGAGTAGEREGAAERFARSNSPEQLKGAIRDVVQPLLGGQLQGLQRQFKVSTGLPTDVFYDMLGPQARQFLERPDISPKPSQKDLDYIRAHPEDRDLFMKRFGVEPP